MRRLKEAASICVSDGRGFGVWQSLDDDVG